MQLNIWKGGLYDKKQTMHTLSDSLRKAIERVCKQKEKKRRANEENSFK